MDAELASDDAAEAAAFESLAVVHNRTIIKRVRRSRMSIAADKRPPARAVRARAATKRKDFRDEIATATTPVPLFTDE